MEDQELTGRMSRRPLAGGLGGLRRLQARKPPDRMLPGFNSKRELLAC
jgi:hypothetical protein